MVRGCSDKAVFVGSIPTFLTGLVVLPSVGPTSLEVGLTDQVLLDLISFSDENYRYYSAYTLNTITRENGLMLAS